MTMKWQLEQMQKSAVKAKEVAKKKADDAAKKKADDAATKKKYQEETLANVDTSTVSGRIQESAGIEGFDDKMTQRLVKGAKFGEAVVGDGLGRLAGDEEVEAIQAQYKELAKGYSSEQQLAMKEKGIEGISGTAASQSRAMQAALARSGVKGQAAGLQLGNIAQASVEARGNLERDLMIENRQAQMEGLDKYSKVTGDIKTFDISQAAKEKDIALQAGLGFAQMGSAEDTAKIAAQAAVDAAKAGKSSGCHVAGTKVKMEDGTEKNIEELEVGDVVKFGGKVVGTGKFFNDEDLYTKNGEIFTGSHLVYNAVLDTYLQASDCCEKVEKKPERIVYPIYTQYNCYYTSFLSGDFSMELEYMEERSWILEELQEVTK